MVDEYICLWQIYVFPYCILLLYSSISEAGIYSSLLLLLKSLGTVAFQQEVLGFQ